MIVCLTSPGRVASLCLLASLALGAGALAAQEDPRIESARSLTEAGRWGEAADSLRSFLLGQPDDPGARWMLGQLLYWLGEHDEALEHYEAALRTWPDDAWIRIGRARVLVALGEWDRAAEGLEALTGGLPAGEGGPPPDEPGAVGAAGGGDVGAAEAEAAALLGALASWSGDPLRAVAWYRRALELNPEQAEARSGLREIELRTQPWAAIGTGIRDDDQPNRRREAHLGAGFHASPLWELTARVSRRILDGGARATGLAVSAGVNGRLPALRLDVSAEGGGLFHDGEAGQASTWIGSLSAAVQVAGDTRVRTRAWRERYAWTRASIDTLLPVEGLEAALDRAGAPGWAGEVVSRVERFPDGNRVRTAYGWVLAPLLPWMRAGYALSWQDALESRWVPAADGSTDPDSPGGGGALPAPTRGRYDPYFTPEGTVVHGLLAEVAAPVGRGSARLDLNVGVHATERAPFATGTGDGASPPVDFASRTFTPWRVRAELDLPLGGRWRLSARAERMTTAFYRLDRFDAGLHVGLGSLPGGHAR